MITMTTIMMLVIIQNSSLVTYEYYTRGHKVSPTCTSCDLPLEPLRQYASNYYRRIRISDSNFFHIPPGAVVQSYNISVSNNNANFSNEEEYTIYDSDCMYCRASICWQRVYLYYCKKNLAGGRQWPLRGLGCGQKKEPKNTSRVTWCAFSHIWGERGNRIVTKFCLIVGVRDIITHANCRWRSVQGFLRERGSNFPLFHWLALSSLRHSGTRPSEVSRDSLKLIHELSFFFLYFFINTPRWAVAQCMAINCIPEIRS